MFARFLPVLYLEIIVEQNSFVDLIHITIYPRVVERCFRFTF